MADENELKELINQAITCENPHVYGTVNLNRLREVLCLLVSVRRPCEASFIANERISNQSLHEETEETYDEIGREAYNGKVPCGSLQDVCNAFTDSAQELSENEVEEHLNSTCRSPSPKDIEQSCTLLSLQNISIEIEELQRKVNEINERVYILETKSPCPEKYQCTCNCGANVNDAISSKSNESHAGEILSPKSSTQTVVSELVVDAEPDEPLNVVDDLKTTCEVVPAEAAHGNSILKSTSVQPAVSASKDFKNNNPAPSVAVVSVEPVNGSVNEQHGHEDLALPALPQDTERKEKCGMVEERVVPKFDELVATMDGLVEREKMFFERLGNIEKLMTSSIDELYARLQDRKCISPTKVYEDKQNVQNLEQETDRSNVPESVDQKNMDTVSLSEANIRSTIDEVRNEICSLKMAFKRLNIAAGGKTDAEIKTHFQCISCNCSAAMEIHEQLIHTPVPFHVRRCMKPILRRQLDWLEKEFKYSAVAPKSMQPYYQLLKQNKLLPPK